MKRIISQKSNRTGHKADFFLLEGTTSCVFGPYFLLLFLKKGFGAFLDAHFGGFLRIPECCSISECAFWRVFVHPGVLDSARL